ncbi:MAG: GGDEF and EAL domain-containing protein [Acidobacteriota bacterium]
MSGTHSDSEPGFSAPALATWDWRVDSDRVAFSSAWHALLGDVKADATSSLHEWLGRIHPDDVAALTAALDRHLTGATETFACEHRLRTASGAFRWVMAQGVAERDPTGKPLRLAGTLVDVSDHNPTDPLVDLPSLVALRAHVERLLEAARHDPVKRFALLLVDIDRFGAVNALLGPEGGDLLLREALKRVARCLREGDLVARIGAHLSGGAGDEVGLPPVGGDECTVALSNLVDARDALRVAARIHDALAAPFPIAGHRLFVSASIGIAMNSAADDAVEDLLRDAHSALVRAQARGLAETQLFDDSARAAASEFMEFASDLDAAIRERQFEMWFQPTVDLRDGSIARAEALLRWRHPTRGLLRPNIFVPLLDDTGTIVPLGWRTIGDACAALAGWRRATAHAQGMRISVNLLAQQFLAPDLVPQLVAAVTAAGLHPGDLEVEISELEAMTHYDRLVEVSRALRAAEFKVALDDFGLGLAATEHIRSLAVHTIKIDRAYIGGNQHQGGSSAIVQYAVELAAILGIDVVAEGVETPTEFAALKQLNCPLGQGFLFSRAVPDEEMLALLEYDAKASGADWWAGHQAGTPNRRRGSDTRIAASRD